MANEEVTKILKDHELRIKTLEGLLKSGKIETIKGKKDDVEKKYAGPKGGVLFLIDQGFLKNRKTATEVYSALDEEGYIYKREVIQTALNRLSNPKGFLVKIEKNGKKVYVQRK